MLTRFCSLSRDYANAMDLHIGVTDSDGVTYEYDSNGLTITPYSAVRGDGTADRACNWRECLPIVINPDRRTPSTTSNRPICPLWKERWDAAIGAVAEGSHWTKDRCVHRLTIRLFLCLFVAPSADYGYESWTGPLSRIASTNPSSVTRNQQKEKVCKYSSRKRGS